ncbi:MAG: TetR/AcrR family transcriptional regulator [Oscillospiraceae bacterium]|nr:TetR/AcrR family transcriptional regulator [Oscillospiraceae bacterium]
MNNIPVREPRQKRSIEKKKRIIDAGLKLFREKGYHDTNTKEIAEMAGVSIGAVYSYFKDKKDIYFATSEHLIDTHVQPFLEELANISKPIDIRAFVNKYIDWFINFCINSKQIINDWALMQEADPEIMQFFITHNKMLLSSLVTVLDGPNINKKNIEAKSFILTVLADELGSEHAFGYNNIDLELLREEIVNMLTHSLTKPG